MKLKSSAILAAIIVALGWQADAQTYDTNGEVVQTFAGAGIPGYIDGQGQSTEFSSPSSIVADNSGNLYVFDNLRIRLITTNATVSTLVGGGNQFEGSGTNVSFSLYNYGVGKMTFDHQNTIWMLASFQSAVYLLTIETNGTVSIENGGLTGMSLSSGLCFDSQNNIYYSSSTLNKIYRYNPTSGISQVFAGSGVSGHLDGNGIFTEFSSPASLVCDQANNIYVQDGGGLRKIDQSQNVTTVTNSSLGNLISVDNSGNILFISGNAIEKFTVTTNVLIYAGTTSFSSVTYSNGVGSVARFSSPSSVCFSQGSIFVTDTGNNRIRQISFNPQPQIVAPANLGIGTYAGVTITGSIGRTYQVQSSPDLSTWTPAATLILSSSPYLWIDPSGVAGNKFYRALLLP
jgi:streptogramin lyase